MKNQSRIPNPEFRIHLVGLVLTMVLLIASLGVFSLTASAAEATIIASGDCSAEGSSVQWTLDDTGTLTISGTGAIESYSIMTHRPWDSYRDDIMSLIIEEGVTEIGVANFKQLKNITAVTLPSTMKKIGINAFAECEQLESVTLNEGLETIDGAAFYNCVSLKTIHLPASLTQLDYSAFVGCALSFTVDEAHAVYSTVDGVLFNKDKTAIVQYRLGNTEYSVPQGVTSIGNYAFSDCTGLTSVKIPNSVTSIDNAFRGCTGLTSIEIPSSVTSINYAFYGCTGLTSIEIPSSVTSMDGAFYNCTGLTSIEIPSSVTSIDNAFRGCTGLTSIEIPSSVISIEGAFRSCTRLTSIEIPSSVTSMDGAFFGCTGLTSIEIPSSVTSINDAFRGCTGLTSIEIPSSVTSINDAFRGCTGLTSVKIPNSVTSIDYAFYGCTGLTSVKIPNGVTTISSYTFGYCTGLTSIEIPHSVTMIEPYAFSGCTKLLTVTTSCTPQFSFYDYDWNSDIGRGVFLEGKHTYENGVCTICDESCPGHTGGNPTCTTPDVCTVCGTEYLNPDNHEYEKNNGICCDTYQPAELNESGYYEIGNAGQLFWFANHINTVDRTASAVLVADIDLENRPWTPIGSTGEENNNFRGVFDGQNYTIRGLYVEGSENGVGFFGEVRTGTVKNFTIYGNVVVNTEVDYVGGVIGSICGVNGETDLERNGTIIQNITSYVNLTAKVHGIGKIGGFVGYANHESLIENCSWYGTFDAGIYRVYDGAGGFIGHIYTNSSVTIRNCAAYGTIKTDYVKNSYNNYPTIYMGGFLSFSNTGAGTVLENCLFAGKFERGENLTDEAFLGAFGTLRSVNAIKNCYYLGDGVLEAVHSNSDLKPGSDNVEITSVTKAQLLSGEVAYKLQGTQNDHFWGQTLTGDNRQSYPVLGGEAVPSSRFEIYGQQLNIGGDLSMKYYVMGYAPEFNSKGLYMEFSHNGVKTKVYAGEPNDDGFYVFILEGINPQCMGDSIRAMLCYNETEVASHGCEDGKEYSVEKNLLNLLEKYKDDAALVALINDTLAYGKAASEYKKHDTMTGDYAVSDSTIPDATVTPSGAFTGYTVVFGQVNFIKVSVALADGYTLYLDGIDITTQLIDGIFKIDGIAPTEFDQKFTFEIKNGDTSVQTFAVSVNDYIGAQKNSATMGNLVKALYNYGVSAEIYNHVANGVGEHTYTYIDNGDGTHDKVCTVCGDVVADNENHTIENHVCTACGAMEIVVSFDAGDFEWKTGDTLYFCRVSRDNQWEEYCFTATVAEDGTVTWTPDKPLYWDGTGEHRLFVSYPCTAVGWDGFVIPTDQSDVDKLKEADCMNARWVGTPTTNVIEFELKHRMAKITVYYVIASQFDLNAPVIAEIYSNAKYCTFSDADGLPIITSVGQYDAWITPYHNANQFTVYVAPGEYNTDGMFKFYIDAAEVQIEITNPGAVTLEEGGEYTFDVKVGQDKYIIEKVSTSDIDSPFGYGWNSETDLKAIGTQAEGKTAWENGDQIIVTFTSPWFGTQYGTLTYDASDGSWSTDESFSYLEGETPTVSAIYAPCYEVVDGNMQLKEGMQLGMTEYISAACSITDVTLNISFEGATRNYSRLRIVGLANQTLTVITKGFTPAGATEEASESYTLTTDEDGNADLYGMFAEGATILVQLDGTELAQYSFYESTANGMSYALDALSAQE